MNNKSKGLKLGLKYKLALSYISLITALVILITIVSLRISENILITQVTDNKLTSVHQIKGSIEILLNSMIEQLNTIRLDRTFMESIFTVNDLLPETYEEEIVKKSVLINAANNILYTLSIADVNATYKGTYIMAITKNNILYVLASG